MSSTRYQVEKKYAKIVGKERQIFDISPRQDADCRRNRSLVCYDDNKQTNKHTFTIMKPFNVSGDGNAVSVSGIGRMYRFSVVVG